MLDRQICLDSLRGTPNRLAGPCIVFWWTGPTDPGWPNLSRKGIGVNTPTQMKIHFLVLEFVALYIRGVQLVRLIVLSIGSPNQCFVNKVDGLNESVPMDVDSDVVVKAQDDMEIDNDPVGVDNDLQDLMEIHNDPMEVD